MSYLISTPPFFGRVIQVDAINGNDSTGKRGLSPFKTINAAVSASASGDTIWVSPGTYELTSPITMTNGTALRGMSVQTTLIQMTNVTGDTTLLTMGENCRVEDVTLSLTSTGHHTLVGIDFPGTSSVTSKLRPTVVTVDNSSASTGGSSNVYGVLCSGTGSLGTGNFSFNSLKGITVNVRSAGGGNKRGIYVTGAGAITTRDFNLYVTGSAAGGGSFVGVETVNPTGQVQLRSSTVYGMTSDIKQSSGSIELGPGTDLLNKTAGGKNFTTYVYPTTIFYGCIGALSSSYAPVVSNYTAYLTPGAGTVQAAATTPRIIHRFPDPEINFYSTQQKAICFGLFVSASIGPGAPGNETKVVVMKNRVDTLLTGSLTGSMLDARNYSISTDFNQFDLLSLRLEYTGSTNTTHNLFCQVDMY